jgi:hypothetical protein
MWSAESEEYDSYSRYAHALKSLSLRVEDRTLFMVGQKCIKSGQVCDLPGSEKRNLSCPLPEGEGLQQQS